MERLIEYLSLIAITSTLLPYWRARTAVQRTTLISAWRWGGVGLTVWIAAAAGQLFAADTQRGIVQLVWYAAALLMLCPAIAVLGAQRPVARVWSWFIVLPFLLVFGWPAAATVSQTLANGQFLLQTPMVVGYAFVVVMGLGNYLGTRFTLAAALTAGALLLVVAPTATADFSWLPQTDHCRLLATLFLTAALWWAAHAARPTYAVRVPLDRVWIEFRDQFGIVWSKRVLDRLNLMAQGDQLSLRMSLIGVTSLDNSDTPPTTTELAAMERSLRWLLRRFVDEAWIDRQLRLGNDSSA